MSQATERSTLIPSRRAVLAGIAAAPALAAPALALPDTSADDAELLVLGSKLDAIEREWTKMTKIDRSRLAAFEATVEAVTGIRHEDRPRSHGGDDVAWKAYFDTRCELAKAPREGQKDLPWNELHDRLFPLVEEILTKRPKTTAGLAVQARAAVIGDVQLWDDGAEEDDDRQRAFIEAVCSFLGITPVRDLLAMAPGEAVS